MNESNTMNPETKQTEKGETYDFEHYNVEDAIRIVRELGDSLIDATKHAKHHFRREWLDQLIARYRERPGKPIVHLSDLPDQVIPTLSPDVREPLRPYWEKLVSEHGSEWGALHFRCMWDIMNSRKVSRWSSLRLWIRFSELTGFRVDDLEPCTVAIRAANTGTSRVISNPKLPFDLATPQGAKLLGYRGDAVYDTSAFVNKDRILHQDYQQAILATVGEVPFTTTNGKRGCNRTNVGVLVTMLATVAGFDNTRRQKFASNPLPSWLFISSGPVVAACQRAVWDSEGSPTRDALKLGQSVHCPALDNIPAWKGPKKRRISGFPPSVQEEICALPPLLLASTALLIHRQGILSYMAPLCVEQTKQGKSAVWMLCIYRTKNMRSFEQQIGFLSQEKQERLSRMNLLHKPRSSPPPLFLL